MSAKTVIYTRGTSGHFTPTDILTAAHTWPVTIKELCCGECAGMCVCVCVRTGRLCKQKAEEWEGWVRWRGVEGGKGGGSLAVLVAINHLGAPYPLTFARV